MKCLHNLILTFVLGQLIHVHVNFGQELNYEFVHEKNYYSFTGILLVGAEPDCLIDLIYNFDHISKYSSGATSIQLIQQDENWFDVAFIYKKLMFIENESTWRRTLSHDKRKVAFEMLSNKSNIRWIPKLISSTGHYQITSTKNGSLVEYFQECELEHGALQSIYIREAKKEAIQFLKIFEKYLSNNCEKTGSEKLIYLNNK